MRIPKNILKQWKTLYTRGDQANMAKGCGHQDKDEETIRKYISTALKGGDCTDEIFIIIRDFYNERIELLNTALPNDKRLDTIKSNAAATAGGLS